MLQFTVNLNLVLGQVLVLYGVTGDPLDRHEPLGGGVLRQFNSAESTLRHLLFYHVLLALDCET